MIFVLPGIALALLYLPLLAYRLGRRLPARDWSRMATLSFVTGASALLLSLLFIAAPPVLRSLGAGEFVDLCDEVLGHLPHGTPLTGWIATSLLLASTVLGIHTKVKTRRALEELTVEPFIGVHVPTPEYDLVILNSKTRLAYSRQARRPQVVVTDGLIALLSGEEFQILLRHELAHLRFHHERDLQVVTILRLALKWLPGVSRSASVARLAMERLADEEAVRSRPLARKSLARALLVTASGSAPDAVLAFNHVQALSERLSAMKSDTPPLTKSQSLGLRVAAGTLRLSGSTGAAFGLLLTTGVCIR